MKYLQFASVGGTFKVTFIRSSDPSVFPNFVTPLKLSKHYLNLQLIFKFTHPTATALLIPTYFVCQRQAGRILGVNLKNTIKVFLQKIEEILKNLTQRLHQV